MNRQALALLEKSTLRQDLINVGDFVTATVDGASFTNCYVHSFDSETVVFQKGNTLFDCPRLLAEQTTLLLMKWQDTPKFALIQEIKALLGEVA